MPESVLFKEVLPGRGPSEEQWLKLIEERAESVEYVMDRVTLTELGRVRLLPNGLGRGPLLDLAGGKPEEVRASPSGLGLETQGIYLTVWPRECVDTPRRSLYCLIGFTRRAQWVVVRAVEETVQCKRYLRSVVIEEMPLGGMIKEFRIGYPDLLFFLTREFFGWAETARERADRLQAMHQRFASEDRILMAMSAERKEGRG